MTTQAKSKGSGTAAKKSAGGDKSYAKTSRCWPGYVPVPGKSEHEEGSCRKAPASRNGGKEVDRETARKKQIALGGKRAEQAKGKSPDAAERRGVSKAKRSGTTAKSAAAKKGTGAKGAAPKRP